MKTGRRKVWRRPKRRLPNGGLPVKISYQGKGGHDLIGNGPIRFRIAKEKDQDLWIQSRAICATVVVVPSNTSHIWAPTSDWSIREGGEGAKTAILEKRTERRYEVTAGVPSRKTKLIRSLCKTELFDENNGRDVLQGSRPAVGQLSPPPHLSKRKGPSKSLYFSALKIPLYFRLFFYTHPHVYTSKASITS